MGFVHYGGAFQVTYNYCTTTFVYTNEHRYTHVYVGIYMCAHVYKVIHKYTQV